MVTNWDGVTSASKFAFNGAISPDRALNAFGSDMVLGFDASSTTSYLNIYMLSWIPPGPQSGWVLINPASTGPNEDFSCSPTCRWGDYAGASPDPSPYNPMGFGRVWLTNEWNQPSVNTSDIDWKTWNWEANPSP